MGIYSDPQPVTTVVLLAKGSVHQTPFHLDPSLYPSETFACRVCGDSKLRLDTLLAAKRTYAGMQAIDEVNKKLSSSLFRRVIGSKGRHDCRAF